MGPCPSASKGILPSPPSTLSTKENPKATPLPLLPQLTCPLPVRMKATPEVQQNGPSKFGMSHPGRDGHSPAVLPGRAAALCSNACKDFSAGRAPKELELMISNGILNSYILLFMIMQYFIWVI